MNSWPLENQWRVVNRLEGRANFFGGLVEWWTCDQNKWIITGKYYSILTFLLLLLLLLLFLLLLLPLPCFCILHFHPGILSVCHCKMFFQTINTCIKVQWVMPARFCLAWITMSGTGRYGTFNAIYAVKDKGSAASTFDHCALSIELILCWASCLQLVTKLE